MSIVEIFHGCLLPEPGVSQQAAQSLVFPVGFFILGEKTNELCVGEFGMLGIREPFGKSPGHTEKLQGIEDV
jgi:hypothetical protein